MGDPKSLRLLMNFQNSGSWTCHFLEADCKTVASRYIGFPSLEALREFYLRCNPEEVEDFEHCIRAWNKGSASVNLKPEQYAKLKK